MTTYLTKYRYHGLVTHISVIMTTYLSYHDNISQSILSHYNSNVNDTIEGPELHAFVGDIARYLGLKLSLSVIEAGVSSVKVIIITVIANGLAVLVLYSLFSDTYKPAAFEFGEKFAIKISAISDSAARVC